eukprot:1087045_1
MISEFNGSSSIIRMSPSIFCSACGIACSILLHYVVLFITFVFNRCHSDLLFMPCKGAWMLALFLLCCGVRLGNRYYKLLLFIIVYRVRWNKLLSKESYFCIV